MNRKALGILGLKCAPRVVITSSYSLINLLAGVALHPKDAQGQSDILSFSPSLYDPTSTIYSATANRPPTLPRHPEDKARGPPWQSAGKAAVTLEVIRQLILVVSLDSRTHGLHPHDSVHTSLTINSPMVLDCHRAGTTFFPPSMPVTGGSTNVIPLSFRRTSSPRGQWANLHLAMPCVSDYSVSVYCPRTFSLPGPLFFLDRDMAIAGWERSDPVRGACIKVEFGAISRANCLIDDSDDRIHWFSDYGSNWIEFIAALYYRTYVQIVLQLAWYKTRELRGHG
ncbi:hypothetical protein BJV77DRAFT_1066592 [Russula vinacea]|nr:hypothetical protein BJV77DRAFT_1066592 [Russula vinacea]